MKKLYIILVLAIAFLAVNFKVSAQDLYINPGGMVTVKAESSIYIKGADNQLIINSPTNSGAPGSLINYNTDDTHITAEGGVVFNRFLSRAEWHMIGSPVQNMAVAGVNQANNNNLFYLDEVAYEWKQKSSGTMDENLGYITFDNVYKTVPFTGALYSSAAITVNNASYTNNGNGETKTGVHLLANKFTSAIDLEEVTGSGIGNTFYIYNGNDYASYNNSTSDFTNGGTRYVAATQAFAYYVTGSSNSITIPQTAKMHNNVIFLKKSDKSKTINNSVRFNVSGNSLTSEMLLYFTNLEGVTTDYDSDYDGVKMFSWNNAMPGIYSVTETNANLIVDVLPETVMEDFIRPVGFRVMTAGTYTISVSDYNFDSNFPVYLEDTYTGEKISLNSTAQYTFSSAAGEFAGRFNLLFNPTSTQVEIADGSSIKVFANQQNLYINLNTADLSHSKVEIYNVLGKKIMEQTLENNQTVLNLDVETGNYIVKVISDGDTKTAKIFIE